MNLISSNRICIGVVFGGKSGEHKISILSAKTVINALRADPNKELFDVVPIYIDQQGQWFPDDIAEGILNSSHPAEPTESTFSKTHSKFTSLPKGSERIDIWYPVLHGPNGEDGTVQGLFTLTGKPFVGSGVLGSAVGMDKLAMKAAFRAAGLPQVPYIPLNAAELIAGDHLNIFLSRVKNELGYPCFVKPANLGSSVGITKINSPEELLKGLRTAAKFDQRIVVEQGIKARELECAVIGKNELKASLVGEISFESDWYDFQTKYSEGSSKAIIPASIPEGISQLIRELSLKACLAISAHGMARVDFFYEENKNAVWINEINTLPGFTPKSMYPMLWAASGVTVEELVRQLVDTARE